MHYTPEEDLECDSRLWNCVTTLGSWSWKTCRCVSQFLAFLYRGCILSNLTQVVRIEGCLRLQNPCLANFLDYRTLPHWFTETEIEPGYRFTTSRRIVFDHNVFTLLGLLKALFRLRKAPLLNPSLLYWTRRNIPHWSKYRIATYFCLSSCLCCIQWCWLFQNGWIQNYAVTLMADGISWSHQQHT